MSEVITTNKLAYLTTVPISSNLMNLEELKKRIDTLPLDDRLQIAQHLIEKSPGLTIIVGGSNMINNGFAVQLNGTIDEVADKVKDLPTETLSELLNAIAIRIASERPLE